MNRKWMYCSKWMESFMPFFGVRLCSLSLYFHPRSSMSLCWQHYGFVRHQWPYFSVLTVCLVSDLVSSIRDMLGCLHAGVKVSAQFNFYETRKSFPVPFSATNYIFRTNTLRTLRTQVISPSTSCMCVWRVCRCEYAIKSKETRSERKRSQEKGREEKQVLRFSVVYWHSNWNWQWRWWCVCMCESNRLPHSSACPHYYCYYHHRPVLRNGRCRKPLTDGTVNAIGVCCVQPQ